MAAVWNSSMAPETLNSLATEQISKEKKSIPFPFGPCRICQDNATGVHYGVVTCEGCKGFFKRMITQGTVSECFFGGQCLVNIETRNRCKACRFRRCIEEGMSMESVKMGRIPKKIKEEALRERQKYFPSNLNNGINPTASSNVADDDWSLSNPMNDSSTSNSSLVAHFQTSSEFVSCVDRTNKTNNPGTVLSALRLPSVFSTENQQISSNNQLFVNLETPIEPFESKDKTTVFQQISKVSENILIDFMFSCEIRYSTNVLRTMKYLSPKLSQPFLIYELDFQLTSFFRYLRWKMFKIYSKHAVELQRLIQRMFGIINLGIVDFPGSNADTEQMWISVQNGIERHVKYELNFVEDTPGLNELNEIDLKRILTNRIFDFWLMTNYPLFYQGESYLLTVDGLQYTRYFMNKFIGKEMTDALHEFSGRLQALNITQIEHSLMIPIVLCQPDPEFVEIDAVQVIQQSYLYALYIQMSATRTEQEAKTCFEQVLEMINQFKYLDELYKRNIRDLVIDKERKN